MRTDPDAAIGVTTHGAETDLQSGCKEVNPSSVTAEV